MTVDTHKSQGRDRLLDTALRDVMLALTAQTDLEAVLDEILDQIQRVIPHNTANIGLLDDGILRVARSWGYERFGCEAFVAGLEHPLTDFPLHVEIVESRKPLVITDTRQTPEWVSLEQTSWIRSCLMIPVCAGDHVLGVLQVDSDTPGHFSDDDAQRLEVLATAAAIAIRNARLYEATQEEIVERKQTEAALRKSEQRHEDAERAAHLGSWEMDIATGAAIWSDEFFRICGYEPGSIEPSSEIGFQIIHPDDRERADEAVNETIETGRPYDIEKRIVRPDGTVRWVHSIGHITYDRQGQPGTLLGSFQDITERKRAEESLRESEEKYDQLFENMPSGVAVYEPVDHGEDFVFVDFNEAAEALESVERDRVIGKRVTRAFPGVRDLGLLDVFRTVWKTGEPMYHPAALYEDERIASWRDNWVYKLPSGLIVAVYNDISERKQAEKALRESETFLRQIIDGSPNLLFVKDAQGRYVLANQAIADLYDTCVKEMLGKTDRELAAADRLNYEEAEGFLADDREVLETDQPKLVRQECVTTADGETRWFQTVKVPLRSGRAAPATLGVSADITERKEMEEALRRSKSLLDATGRMARVGGWEMDAETMVVSWTAETYRIHDVPLDYVPPLQEAIDFFHPEDRKRLSQAIDRALEHGEPYDMELRFITAQGNQLWTRTICRPQMVDGKTIKLVGTFQDITERKQMEEELRRGEERYRNIFQSAGVGIWEEDFSGAKAALDDLREQGVDNIRGYLEDHPDFVARAAELVQVRDVNQATLKMLGADSKEQLTGQLDRVFCETTTDIFLNELVAIAEGRRYFEGETVNRTLDGERRDVLLTMAIPEDPHRLDSVLVSTLDITERNQLAEQLRHQERLAAVGQLAGGIAHDFNNLLAAIILNAQMPLRQPDLTSSTRDALETILDESHRAANLVQQILDFSRRAMLDVEPVDLVALVHEAMTLLRRTIPEHIHMTTEMQSPLCTIKADATRIHQMLMNLVLNARDAMPQGGDLRIQVKRVTFTEDDARPLPEMPSGSWACMTVSDTGTGMTEEAQDHLFEPFFTTKDHGQGTGLGLAQVYGIVKQHQGFIRVDTAVGEGTMFTVYLPLAEDAEEPGGASEWEMMPSHGEGETILVIEDSKRLRAAIKSGLESLGYHVVTAINGREALEMPLEGLDLVLTDMVMPRMGGDVLLQALCRQAPQLKVVAMTGHVLDIDIEHLKASGFASAILKPFSIRELNDVVRDALDDHGRRR